VGILNIYIFLTKKTKLKMKVKFIKMKDQKRNNTPAPSLPPSLPSFPPFLPSTLGIFFSTMIASLDS
jgi:hypothetical protein